MDEVDDTVCVVDIALEVSEDPSEPYEEEDEGGTVETRVDGPAELEPEVEMVITLDDSPELVELVL